MGRDSTTTRSFLLAFAFAAAIAGSPACGADDGDDDATGDGSNGDGDGAGDGAGDGDGSGDGSGDGAGDGSGDGDGEGDGSGDGEGDGDDGPPSVCDDASFAPASAVVSDLEDESVVGWDIYPSSAADSAMGAVVTAPESGSFEDPPALAMEGGGDPASTRSVHFAGTGWKGYGAGMNFNLEGCKDLTEYSGVRFWARGSSAASEDQTLPPNLTDNTISFRIITAGSHAIILNEDGVNVGGDCDASVQPNKCFLPPQKDITLTSTWTLHELPFTELKTPAGANPGSAFSGTNAMLLGWHSSNGDFDVYVDEVEFY